METPPTRTYLNDHRVGAGVALGVIDRLLVIGRRGRRHDELVKLLEWLKAQLVSDRATLEEVAGLIDAPIDPLHRAFGRIAGGMAALKLTAPMSGSESGALLLGLEALATGIQGKAALWRSLRALGSARLAPVDLAELIRRADTQFSAVEAARLETSRVVLAG